MDSELIPKVSSAVSSFNGGVQTFNDAFANTSHPQQITLREQMSRLFKTAQQLHIHSNALMKNTDLPQHERAYWKRVNDWTLSSINQMATYESSLSTATEKQKLLALITTNTNDIEALNRTGNKLVENLNTVMIRNSSAQEAEGELKNATSLMHRIVRLSQQIQATPEQLTINKSNSGGQLRTLTQKFGCVSDQFNHIMSQRFLGWKLMFGKPGAGFECGAIENHHTSERIQPMP